VRLHGSPRHLELAGNLGVVTTLQQQFNDLLLPRTEPNGLLLHAILPFFDFASARAGGWLNFLAISSSTRIATSRQKLALRSEHSFPQALAGNLLAIRTG
jgi:hypothetical protein